MNNLFKDTLNSYVTTKFGDYDALTKFISDYDLEFILNYSDLLFIITAFDIQLDFKEQGAIRNSRYFVHDHEFNFIYSAPLAEYSFGLRELDQLYVNTIPHARYFYIRLDLNGGSRLILIWVSKYNDLTKINSTLKYYRSLIYNKQSRNLASEIYLDTSLIRSILITQEVDTSTVYINLYSLFIDWDSSLSYLNIINHANTIKHFYLLDAYSTITIYPSNTCWYVFELYDIKTGKYSYLKLTEVQGTFTDKLVYLNGAYFINASSSSSRLMNRRRIRANSNSYSSSTLAMSVRANLEFNFNKVIISLSYTINNPVTLLIL